MARQSTSFAPRRSADSDIASAINLGWRMAELFGLNPRELARDASDNLLPARTSLPARDRLVLELRAAAGDADRAGAPIDPRDLDTMLALAAGAAGDEGVERQLCERLRAWHVNIETELWATQEARGRAYELGNFLSDTWNRTLRALRRHEPAAVAHELRAVFGDERVERIKILLDELEARLDPAAVRIVRGHLYTWRDRVAGLVPDDPQVALPFTPSREALEPLRGQTLTWRQLLTGDKEPEAYIDRKERAQVRGVMTSRIAQSYRRHLRSWVLGTLATAAAVWLSVHFAHQIGDWHHHHKALVGGIIAFAGSAIAALGISTTSIVATVRRSIDARAELMWNSALSEVICQQTLFVDRLLPERRIGRVERMAKHLPRAASRAAQHLEPQPPLTPQH
jgi:hypothetical protein